MSVGRSQSNYSLLDHVAYVKMAILFSVWSEAISLRVMKALVYLLEGRSSVRRISMSFGMARSKTAL